MSNQLTEGGQGQSLQPLTELLGRAGDCLAGLGSDYQNFTDDLHLLRSRLVEGRFHLAVLGQFKRGKSTLLNALLGDDLLPTDILPVTAIPTYISSGDSLAVKVHFQDDRQPQSFQPHPGEGIAPYLAEYVTEAGNPHNRLAVSRVEIRHPAELLRQGVVLIDTPGIGSTLKHNTEVAHQVLPQSDAALFLVSPDPPITEVELDYLQEIKRRLPRTFFLLNKVDFLTPEERRASLRFLQEQLASVYPDSLPEVQAISARKGLQARLAEDQHGWQASGLGQVEADLITFLARDKQQTLEAALGRRCANLLSEAILQLQLSLSALKLPEDQLRERIEQFRQTLPAIERERQAADDVLAGDLKRAISVLGEKVEAVRGQIRERVARQIDGYFDAVEDPEELERLVRQAVAAEIQPCFTPALSELSEAVREEAVALLTHNQQRSNQLIEQVRKTAAELFAIPYNAPAARTAYVSFEAPVWSQDLFISDMDPLGQRLSRRFLSKKYRRRKIAERLREEVRRLLNQNLEQISWTLRRTLDESFRQFAANLREQLEKTIQATRQAMEIALERSASQSRETAERELQLQQGLAQLEKLRSGLKIY